MFAALSTSQWQFWSDEAMNSRPVSPLDILPRTSSSEIVNTASH
jgi:hypothetical protein